VVVFTTATKDLFIRVVANHAQNVIISCAQTLYARETAIVVARLLYAAIACIDRGALASMKVLPAW